jgi:ligand-binding sensor domain-containing protein/serine phosphatase RsbU (regulator of sigma subunit)
MIYRIIAAVFIPFLLITNIWAQSHIRFKHLTVEDGLSQSSVTCIFQDKKGFMWFGTQDGLNRYDGYGFTTFKNDPSDSNSLSDNFIFSIYEDKKGNLFIETETRNFHKYNPIEENFTTVVKENTDLTGARFNSVDALLIEPSGIKWTGGLGGSTGLKMEDTNSGEVKQYLHNPSDPYSLSDDRVYSIFRDSKGSLWIGTYNGLDRFDEKSGRFFHYRNTPGDPNSLPDNWVWPIFEDAGGNLWIGTVRGGLSKFDPQNNSFINYKSNLTDPTSLNDDFIFSIYQDDSDVLWIGTNSGGINYFHPSTQSFEHYVNESENKNSLSHNEVLSLAADNEGNYWIGTGKGGLNKFDYKKRKFKSYTHNPLSSNSISSDAIQLIYQDKSGILWLGNFSSGLDAFDLKNETIKHYKHNPSDSNSISDNRVISVIEDSDGIIWIGTYGGGLNRFDKKSGKIIRYLFDEKDSSSISANSAWSITEGRTGLIWVGTFGGGVSVLDKSTGKFTRFKNNPNDSTSLIDDNVVRVFTDSKGNIWIGSPKGLSKFENNGKRFKNFREKDGLANDFVYGILEDNNGDLWISTNNGISKFNPKSEIFNNYYYDDGLQANEFNQNAFAKDHKTGRLLFGGANGFNIFHPDSIAENQYVPPVAFTGFKRYNTDDEEGKPIIEKGISARDSILLTYKDNIITLEFSALNFNNNLKNQYRYMLEGFNKNWIQLGNNRTVTFTNLSPGEYNLTVLGSNNDGVWNEEGASLFIEVTPPWWRTNLAYVLYGVAFISLLGGVRKFEIDRREQKSRIRETELRMKATEAEKRAIEIENERKTKELEEARQLQLSMLPKELPQLSNVELAAYMRTATEVGGDYYDFIVQDNGVLNIAFGDATGHGLQAGTMVTLMKGFFTSDAARLGLEEFMNHCNEMIRKIKLGRILMSFSFARIEHNKLSVTSAGMPPIYHYNSRQKTVEEIIIQGMPLGAMRKFSYKLIEKEVCSGDIILMLTDGLPEQMNTKEVMFDYPRVHQNFKEAIDESPDNIIKNLVSAADTWMDGAIQSDDITFVVIKIK